MPFAWTKFQDFYLRLGFLKVLVGALDASRRSALNEAIERRLRKPLFEPADKFGSLWARVKHAFPQKEPRTVTIGSPTKYTTVAEALLFDKKCPSLLFAITPDTTYKILDWGHDVHLLGRGNQITERALILKQIMPAEAIERFLAGDVDAWDPFTLTIREKVFFLFHLGQLDSTLVDLVDLLGEATRPTLESKDAAALYCSAFLKFLERVGSSLAPRDIPAFRTARDLACVIAEEQDMLGQATICKGTSTLNKIGKKGAKRPGLVASGKAPRKANKNSDHQTIPRFEQLADLGLVTKGSSEDDELADRRRWRYAAGAGCAKWHSVRAGQTPDRDFLTHAFSGAVVAALGLGDPTRRPDERTIASYFWRAYQDVRRPVGHTPFDSVALLAMIYAAEDGIAIEIGWFHELLLKIKTQDLLPEVAFFASGNEIEKMFLVLKADFFEALSAKMQWGTT